MSWRSPHDLVRLAIAAVLMLVLAACGGGDDTSPDSTGDAPDPTEGVGEAADAGADSSTDDAADDPSGSGADTTASTSFVEVDGEIFEFDNVIDCIVGDAFWGPDFRRISLDTGGEYPAISVGYAPPKADDEGVEDPNGVAVFPSIDPWWYSSDASGADDFELTLTADGVAGTATVGVEGEGGPDGEALATFELSCADATGTSDDSDSGDSPDESDEPGGTEAAPDIDTGTVSLAGETYELTGPSRSDAMIDPDLDMDPSSDDFDFDICETVNPAFEGAFNIVGTLDDGTPFRLSGNVNEPFDDLDGLFLGESLDEERAEATEVSLSGRTLSGSATTSRGDLEFSFTC